MSHVQMIRERRQAVDQTVRAAREGKPLDPAKVRHYFARPLYRPGFAAEDATCARCGAPASDPIHLPPAA